MMKTKYNIPVLLAGLLSLASCNDKEPNGGNNPANPQDGINFTIGQESPSSRTHYASNDWLQIEWDMNDLITIACAQTQAPTDDKKTSWTSKTSAVYKVNKLIPYPHDVFEGGTKIATITTNSKAGITANSSSASEALYWGSGEHTFYAGYGENISINPSTGRATCQYKTEQTLSEVNGTWINMSHAYMVASTTTNPTESVNLIFQPIMTTLDIELNGMTSGAAGAKAIKVMSMEVTIEKDADVLYTTGDDMYFDINFSPSDATDATERYKITTDPDKKAEKSNRTITFAFEPGKAPTVEVGGSLSITAILPRIDIGGTNGKPVTITINTEDGSNMFTFNDPVKSGYKAKILTKPWVKPEKAIDLGLPSGTKWAVCNLGANEDYEIGDYYGWGCSKPYGFDVNVSWTPYFNLLGLTGTSYSSATCGGSDDPLKGYVNNNKSISGSEFDAVNTIAGGKWRMPTDEDFQELMNEKDNCTWKWTDNYNNTGVKGYEVTSKKNGNSIFLPATGYRNGEQTKNPDYGYYWSSTPTNNTNAYILLLSPNNVPPKLDNANRRYGFIIRPVWNASMPEPTDPTEIKEVDLGLPSGTKWASRCLGPTEESSSTADSGKYGYFGWGCTTSYPATFNNEWQTYFNALGLYELEPSQYAYACGSKYDPLAKYANNPDQHPLAGSEHDIAYTSTNGKWRTPTKSEWEELLANCTCAWGKNDNGESGYKMTSNKNGNSIFLPAAGFHHGTYGAYLTNMYGLYWSSTPDVDLNGGTQSAWYLEFNYQGELSLKTSLRCKAYTIYPVAAK